MLSRGFAAQRQLKALLDSVESLQREFGVDMDWEPTVHTGLFVREDESLGPRTAVPSGGTEAGGVSVAAPGTAVVRRDGDEGGTGEVGSDVEMKDADEWALVESWRCKRST